MPGHVGFVVDNVTLGQAYVRVFRFYSTSAPYSFISLPPTLYNISNDNVVKQITKKYRWEILLLKCAVHLQNHKYIQWSTDICDQFGPTKPSPNSVFICVEKKNQLDVTVCFIAFMICSTCFGQFYAHHQELETICVLLPPMVCSACLLIVGGQVQGSRVCVQEEECCTL